MKLYNSPSLQRVCCCGLTLAALSLPSTALAQDGASASAATPPPPQTAPSNQQPAAGPGLLTEPRVLTNGIQFAVDKFGDSGREKRGWYPEFSNMITGSGFVSVGPGYRHYVFNDQAFLDASAALSWHFYKTAQARFEARKLANNHLTLGTQVMWQDSTQINYFGIGPDSLEDDQSQYRLKSTDIVGYGAYRPMDWLSIGGEFGWLRSPSILSTGGTFKPTFPEAQHQFPTDPGMQLEEQPDFLHSEASITADTRNYPGHPTHGGLYRAALTSYGDRTTDTFSFHQYEAEAMHFVPITNENWIFAVHGWAVFTDTSQGHEVPFYLLPSLGGHSTLRAFSNFRFHDRNLAMVSAESRWALFTHVDGAIFFDAGNVAPRRSDLNLDKTSIGAGVRIHTQRMTFARFDVAHGAEGWHFTVRTSDAFRLSRLARRTVVAPFVP
jgi:hypothetical protein